MHTPMYKGAPRTPLPDFDAGMAGLQIAVAARDGKELVSASGPSPLSTVPRAKPSVPQKKGHIDELVRIRKDIEEMREERDQALGERDAMADDMLKIQEELDEKDEELKKMSREVWTWREKAETLINDKTGPRGRRALVGAEASSLAGRESTARMEQELAQAREQVQQLTASLAESNALLSAKTVTATVAQVDQNALMYEAQRESRATSTQAEEHWRSEAIEQQKLRQAAEDGLQSTKSYYEVKIRSVESQGQEQLREQQRRLHDAEAALRDRSQQMEIDSGGSEELDQLRRQAAELQTRVDDQHQCVERFRRMSERLTTQVKQAKFDRQNLEQSEQTMRRHIEDMRTQAGAYRGHFQSKPMPGAFGRSE